MNFLPYHHLPAEHGESAQSAVGPRRKSQQGFTLLEILIAIVVLAIGVLGVASMQTAAGGSNSVARQIMTAENLASQQLETFMLLPYDDPQLELTPPPADPHANDIEGYTISWRVGEELLPEGGIKTITLTVRSNATRAGFLRPSVVLTHYKANL
jgi:type IV pilus assembly protein PilV